MAEAAPGSGGRPSTGKAASPRRRSTSAKGARRKPAARKPRAAALTDATVDAAANGRANGNRWLELVLSVIQAPVGIAQSQAEVLVTQLEKTGSIGQREADRLLTELRRTREKAQGRAEQEAGRFDRFIESKIEDVLNRINIPSRSDIERLNASVDMLTAKVESLVSRHERGGTR